MPRLTTGFALLLLIAGCGGETPSLPAPDVTAGLARITVSAEGMVTGHAWDGVVEAVQQADLSAQTTGRVAIVSVDVNDRVEAGQVLLRLTAVEQQAGADAAKAQLRAAEASAAEAEANYARFVALSAQQFVSKLQLDQTKSARDAAVANRDSARARLAQAWQAADYTVVRAPFAGVVSARRVEPGESVEAGQALMSIYAPGALRIEVQVPQAEAAQLRAVKSVSIVLADGRKIEAGTVIVFPAADPATHSVTVRVLLPKMKGALQPGVATKVLFPIDGRGEVTIPRSAVAQHGELTGVYVLAENRMLLRQLRLGQVVGDQVEVLAGLNAGEVIASDPVAAVQALAVQRKAAGNRDE